MLNSRPFTQILVAWVIWLKTTLRQFCRRDDDVRVGSGAEHGLAPGLSARSEKLVEVLEFFNRHDKTSRHV